ncbi:MAG TPA: MmcQ/YjbR family DNA-binding protein [Fimbriimonadales bacterium]|jgi:predicted DNA-binding protein (MmcQ/YjbR family)|nr:MmcQ/YjbR family DNA-binding protein [Fimbriimonadales bacterium]
MNQLDRLRPICLALPDVIEKLSHGEPAWFVRGRLFAMFADEHHDNRIAVWCSAPEGMQQTMIAGDPEHYFRPPYVGPSGWIGVYLDVPLDWSAVADAIAEAHRTVLAKVQERSKKKRR